MKKFWIYMAVPMTLLNGCQAQQANAGAAGTVKIEERVAERALESDGDETGGEEETEGVEEAGGKEETEAAAVREAAFSGSTVSVIRSKKARAADITEAEIEAMVRQAAWDLGSVVKNGQTVVIKPNLVQMIVDSTGELLDDEVNGVTTDWRVTKAVLKLVRELNPDGTVYVMEGSATGPTREVMKYFHYTPEEMEGVDGFICLEEDCGEWQDFNAPEVVKVDLPDGLLHQSYYFNRILYEADVVISVPALKTSSGVVVTGGIKNVSIGTPPGNLYGAAPDNPSKLKMVSHKITDGELDKWIYDYYRARPVDYVIVDGLQGFQSGPVPMSHERREADQMNMRTILGGRDAVAVDTICALVTGWDPESVGYLNLFREREQAGKMESIRVRGEFVDEIRRPFTLKKPNLGGTAAVSKKGPEFTADVETDGDRLSMTYWAGQEACRIEVLVDGAFQYTGRAQNEAAVELNIPGLSLGSHQILCIAYDRFLNKTVWEMKTSE